MFSNRQRNAIANHSCSDLGWLLVPGGRWRSHILPADQPALDGLRRRLLQVAGIGATLGLAVFWILDSLKPAEHLTLPSPPMIEASTGAGEPRVAKKIALVADAVTPTPDESTSELTEIALAETRTQPALFGSAKVTAVYAGHDVQGVRVEKVDPQSFWAMVGVRSGDIVIGHNGAAVDSPAAMVALLNSMEQDASIRLLVRGRDDAERTLYYSLPR
ncbi:PDZ domain-containing protein [Myxococcota bacterium]|nr:PDZ domain-containing protein [Myxococcota bacterium]